MTLPISEVFGPTLQGEGPYAGRLADFVRFGGCNLSCSWCDTGYTWDASRYSLRDEIHEHTVEEILSGLSGISPIVVLTGGEPTLYADRPEFLDLLRELAARRRAIHIETNGVRMPGHEVLGLIDVVVISPKLANSGPHRGRQDPVVHAGWIDVGENQEIHLKYVCESRSDVESAVAHANQVGWARDRVWVMPQAADATTLNKRWPVVASAASDFGVNATTRLHLLAWGTERGR